MHRLIGGCEVIKLTKFNSEARKKGEFVLNAEVIQTVEETPDTVITLVNGQKFVVDNTFRMPRKYDHIDSNGQCGRRDLLSAVD